MFHRAQVGIRLEHLRSRREAAPPRPRNELRQRAAALAARPYGFVSAGHGWRGCPLASAPCHARGFARRLFGCCQCVRRICPAELRATGGGCGRGHYPLRYRPEILTPALSARVTESAPAEPASGQRANKTLLMRRGRAPPDGRLPNNRQHVIFYRSTRTHPRLSVGTKERQAWARGLISLH
jgi:hypothetical protein